MPSFSRSLSIHYLSLCLQHAFPTILQESGPSLIFRLSCLCLLPPDANNIGTLHCLHHQCKACVSTISNFKIRMPLLLFGRDTQFFSMSYSLTPAIQYSANPAGFLTSSTPIRFFGTSLNKYTNNGITAARNTRRSVCTFYIIFISIDKSDFGDVATRSLQMAFISNAYVVTRDTRPRSLPLRFPPSSLLAQSPPYECT